MRYLGSGRRSAGLLTVAGALVVSLLLAACAEQPNVHPTSDQAAPGLFPGNVVTTQGQQAADLYLPVFWVAVAVFLLVEGILLYVTLRYRRRPTDEGLPAQTHGNNRLEILWTAIPAVLVFVIFVGSMLVLSNVEAKTDPAVTVDATAYQFSWDFEYPDQGVKVSGAGKPAGPEMVVPVDEPIRIRLHASDSGVIHSFYVPQFFYKRDVIPGRVNEFEIVIDEPGTYGGQCAEFCGLGHAQMFFSVRAVERPDFESWVADAVAQANATPTPGPSGSAGPSAVPSGIVLKTSTTQDDPLAFTETTLTAPANTQVTVEYLNDSDVQHNIAFFAGTDVTAARIAQTEIAAGPGDLQTVTFTTPSEPGSYLFHCDVHPVQMVGTLEVTP